MDSQVQQLNINLIASVIGIGLGLFAHLGFFIHGEWLVYAPPIIIIHSFFYTILLIGTVKYGALWTGGLITSI